MSVEKQGSVRVAVRVRPRASRTAVGGTFGDSLVVKVTALAVAGRATEAALRAMADALGVRRADVRLVIGGASREKVIEIHGDLSDLARCLDELRAY